MHRRKVAAAASLAAAVLTLSACAGQGSPTPSAALPELPADAEYNPRAFEGESIRLLFIEHPFVSTVQPLIPEFEALTGIKVEMEVLAEQQGFDKLQADLSNKAGNYDVFMTDPLHNWQYAAAGWVEPLEDYIASEQLTMPGWDVDDFAPGIYNAGRWTLEPLKGIGEGSTWGLPINFESYNLTYRPSMFEAAGVEVPTTYEELSEAVDKLSASLPADQFPIVTRFDRYWDLTYLTFGSMAQSYGVELLDENGNVGIASERGVEAAELFLEIVKKGSPADASAFTWYEVLQGFSSGRFAIAFNEADLFAPTYENPDESAVSDDVGYALVPEGPEGRSTGAWIWQVSMSSSSKNKGAAWTFMQWLTSKETLLETHKAGNMNPVRLSAWEDAELASTVNEWGAVEGQYREVLEGTAEIAGIRVPPHPELTRALDIWAEALQKSFFDGNTEANLQDAAEQIERILK